MFKKLGKYVLIAVILVATFLISMLLSFGHVSKTDGIDNTLDYLKVYQDSSFTTEKVHRELKAQPNLKYAEQKKVKVFQISNGRDDQFLVTDTTNDSLRVNASWIPKTALGQNYEVGQKFYIYATNYQKYQVASSGKTEVLLTNDYMLKEKYYAKLDKVKDFFDLSSQSLRLNKVFTTIASEDLDKFLKLQFSYVDKGLQWKVDDIGDNIPEQQVTDSVLIYRYDYPEPKFIIFVFGTLVIFSLFILVMSFILHYAGLI